MQNKEFIYALLLVLPAIGSVACFNGEFRANHPSFVYWFCLFFILIFFLVLVISAIFGIKLYRQKKNVELRIRSLADESTKRRESVERIVSHLHAHTWTVKGRTVVMSQPLANKLHTETVVVKFGDALEGLDAKSAQAVVDFLSIDEPGDFNLQVYGALLFEGEHWYELHMNNTLTKSGLEKHGVTVQIDELKNLEKQSYDLHRRISNAQQRERFISMLNHEIRTPLNSILGFSQLLSSKDVMLTKEDVSEISNTIIDNGESLLKLIGNILLLIHMDNSNVSINLIDSNVAENICEGCVLYENERKKRNIKVVVEHGPSEAWVHIDHQFMVTVIDSFASNAVKFSHDNSTIYLGWKIEEDEVVIYVRDEGIGIAPEHQKHIFERFYKVDPFAPGVGLGLSVAREFVKRMNGRITVESELGKGTTFSVRLKKIK